MCGAVAASTSVAAGPRRCAPRLPPKSRKAFSLVLAVVALPGEDAGHLLRGVETQRGSRSKDRGGRAGFERGAHAFDAAVDPRAARLAERGQEATAQVEAEHHRPHERRARRARPLGHRERGRYRRAPGVRLGERVEVVGLVGVREHAVRERGVDRGGDDVGGRDTRLGGAALRTHVVDRELAGSVAPETIAASVSRMRCFAARTTRSGSGRAAAAAM
jgi:hypothetical protein